MVLSVPAIPRRDDVGGGAMPAIHAVLGSLGAHVGYEELLVLSGTAFTFVYDNAPTYEALRDLYPLDSLTVAVQACGFSGRWLVDASEGETLERLQIALGDGRPAVVPIYSIDEIHRCAVAVGYDAASRKLTLQLEQLQEITLPEVWWGAVTGPLAWGRCPVFLTERKPLPGWSAEGRLHRALHRGQALLGGGLLPYRDCEGSRIYSGVPLAGRQAVYGLPAYDLLSADVGGAEILSSFALLWRIDAQVSQLQHSRAAGTAFLGTVPHKLASEAATCCASVAESAGELLSRFWYRPTKAMATAEDVLAAAGAQGAMVFWLGLEGEELARLARRVAVARTPWGPVAIVDTIPRRREAVAVVQRLRESEGRLRQLLGELRDAL